MTKQILKKKKRFEQGIDFLALDIAKIDIIELKKEIKNVMKYHIGWQNRISRYDLFEKLFKIPPENIDSYKRIFLWLLIKKILKEMKSNSELFVINVANFSYVLQTEEELKKYIDNNIKHKASIDRLSKIASEWVVKKQWQNI